MATKNYMINDKWLDLDKQNIVELQSVDGELDSLKVNGSEIVTPSGKITITENGTDIDIAQYALADVNVEGGGGSSDFSTAEVTVTGPTEEDYTQLVLAAAVDYHDPEYPEDDESYSIGSLPITSNSVLQIVLYKGKAYVTVVPRSDQAVVTVSGNIEATFIENRYIVTGDCSITIS